jgi:hypothetical protein
VPRDANDDDRDRQADQGVRDVEAESDDAALATTARLTHASARAWSLAVRQARRNAPSAWTIRSFGGRGIDDERYVLLSRE